MAAYTRQFFFKQMGTDENIHLKVMKTISSPEFHR